ncbi:DUF6888 family protein [Stenomitos frigidus]|nr:hypothetical protein [Stenomitos frigidus]
MPTREQAEAAIFVCQLFSNLFQPINVFRYDQKAKTIYVQGGSADELRS